MPVKTNVEKIHDTLTELGLGEPEKKNIAGILSRIRNLKLYVDSVRGKYARLRRKYRALSKIVNGPATPDKRLTYAMLQARLKEYDDREKQITHELRKHFETNPNLANRRASELPQTILYLVHRSNEYQAEDSTAVKRERERTKDERIRLTERADKAVAKERETQRLLDYYISTFGLKTPPADWSWSETIMDRGQEAQRLVDAAVKDLAQPVRVPISEGQAVTVATGNFPDNRDTKTFPFARGNPFYLGDYDTDELLDEIRRRTTNVR